MDLKRQKPNVSFPLVPGMVCAIAFLIPTTLKAAEFAYSGRLSEVDGKPLDGPRFLKSVFTTKNPEEIPWNPSWSLPTPL